MKHLYKLVSLIVLVGMLLSACVTTPTPTQAPAPTKAPEPTKAPAATVAPAATTAPAATKAPEPTKAPEAKVLKIGMITMKSGALAYYGVAQERGFMIGLEYISKGQKDAQGRYIIAGRPVEVLVRDAEGNPDKATSMARELIEKDGVEILQGPVNSTEALALTAVALQYKKILMVDPAASYLITGTNFNPYVFRTSRTNYDDVLVIAKYLVENVGKNFAHIGIDNAFGKGSGAALKYAVEKNGGKLIADIYAPADTKDFTSYIQKALDSKAENLFLTWAGTGYVTLFQQLNDLGATKKMKVATGFGDNPSFTAVFGTAIGQVGLSVYHYTAPKNEVNDFLVKRYFELYKEPPDLFSPGGMASAIALAAALEKTKGDTTGDVMVKALEGLKFEGPKGTYYIRPEDHVCLQPMYILKLVNLDPHKGADGTVKYDWFEKVYESKYDELGIPCTLEKDYASRCGNLPKP
ncbi:MAG TPA: substrate-binding domain-containing protein [Anaerolineaceae bacterium]